MSWAVASFLILGIALAAGFAWYERQHPSSKVLALVATLAGLAALGRIAFAPIPSVKPTTDIVLIAGFSLGAAPGFVVGAVAALASNVFFGQGPFTPWQMVAWGGVGLFGAGLGRIMRHRVRRIPLALACGVAGMGFGLFMDLHLWVLYAGQHNLAELGVVAGRGVPFNATHAVANVVFFLAFGPLLIGAVMRYRDRMQITWRPAPAAIAPALAALAVAAATLAVVAAAPGGAPDARAATAQPQAHAASVARADRAAVARAVAFLRRAQNRDGGFGGAANQASNQLHTSWAVMGLAAVRRSPNALRSGGRSPVNYVVDRLGQIRSGGDLQRTILALAAADRLRANIKGRRLLAELVRQRRRDGSFAGLVNQTAFGILALRAGGRSTRDGTVRRAGRHLLGQQNGDGGFNFSGRGAASGIDDTAAALMGLAQAGYRGSRSARRAADFIARKQNPDGGFPLNPGGASNAQSAAWAVQALRAAGRDPSRARRGGSRSPLEYLRSLQSASGEIRYSRTSRQTPVWVTAQALTAFARAPFPIRPVR